MDGCHGNPKWVGSKDQARPTEPEGGNIRIYEGTNQIQPVVIAKRRLD